MFSTRRSVLRLETSPVRARIQITKLFHICPKSVWEVGLKFISAFPFVPLHISQETKELQWKSNRLSIQYSKHLFFRHMAWQGQFMEIDSIWIGCRWTIFCRQNKLNQNLLTWLHFSRPTWRRCFRVWYRNEQSACDGETIMLEELESWFSW